MIWVGLGISFILMFMYGCTSLGVVQVNEESSGCTGLLPVPALQEKGINIELANLIVQEVATGKFKVEYSDTMEALLSDQVLGRWVRDEMNCQGARLFESPDQQIWYLQMKEVSEKSSPQEFLQWLKENPTDAFQKKKTPELSLDPDLTFEISYVNGHIMIPPDAFSVNIEWIYREGVVLVHGPTKVTIGNCNGTVKHHKNAKIIIDTAYSNCVQELLE